MKQLLVLFAVIASVWSAAFTWRTSCEMPRPVNAGGPDLRMLITGKESGPVVVFECFGGAPLEWWSRVQPEVARFARCVSYDHAGFNGSEPGPKPRDARQISGELHTALRNARLSPPYLLVGHSFGGPHARVFAGRYPEETAGLVLVDPTQEAFIEWLRKAYPKLNRISAADVAAQEEWGCSMQSLDQAQHAMLPEVPITLISAAKADGPWRRRLVPKWVESHRAWITTVPGGRHIITANSTHGVPYEEPGIVVAAIRQLIDEVNARSSRQRGRLRGRESSAPPAAEDSEPAE